MSFAVNTVHVVLPGDIDDRATPSGGNHYDRQLCHGLAAAGWSVREIAVRGAWPRAGTAQRRDLGGALAALPDGELVLLDGLVANGVPGVVIPEAGRLRIVVLLHSLLGDETGLVPAEAVTLDSRERETLTAAGAVITTSGWSGRRVVEHHGLPAGKVHVAPPGVDPAPLAPGGDGATGLLCVASVCPRKGHDVLVQALSTLADLPWELDCVGSFGRANGYADRLRRMARAYGIDDRVRLNGPRTGDDLAATYASADLLVLASRAETYGMVVTEALARGIPVLTTAVDGLPEALGRSPDGEVPGTLVPPDDPAALAHALRGWLTEPQVRGRWREAARARRTTLDNWDNTVRKVSDVLHREMAE